LRCSAPKRGTGLSIPSIGELDLLSADLKRRPPRTLDQDLLRIVDVGEICDGDKRDHSLPTYLAGTRTNGEISIEVCSRLGAVRGFLMLSAFAGLIGCSAPDTKPKEELLGCESQHVIYGVDERTEAVAAGEPWKSRALAATVALIGSDIYDLWLENPEAAHELSAGAELELCEDEPFAQQPSLADCTGIVLSSELVMTAAHCIDAKLGCAEYVFVQNFAEHAEGPWTSFAPNDVHRCAEVLLREEGVNEAGLLTDIAVIRLLTPLANPAPVITLRAAAPEIDDGLVLVSHPSGLPLKIAGGGKVVDVRSEHQDYFGAELDSFEGSSGGPVFDENGALLGMATAGQEDYVLDATRGCYRSHIADARAAAGKYERVLYATTVLRTLCARGIQAACNIRERPTTAPSDNCASGN
jgi:hypothetical protein